MDGDSLSFAYSYGCKNAGDFAINQGSVALLERTVPEATVTAISRFAADSEEFQRMVQKLDSHEQLQLFGGPITYDPPSQSRPQQLVSLLEDGLRYSLDMAGIADSSRLHSQLYKRIADSEGLLFNGGNAIHYSPSQQRIAYLVAVLYPLQLARRSGVPYALLPQTVFGLEGISKRLVLPILEDAEFVMTRDAKTFRYLSEFGLSTPVINGIDTAFLNGSTSVTARPAADLKRIAVVPRFSTLGDTGNLDEAGARMEETLFGYLGSLVEAGHKVTLTVQTEIDDRWLDRNRQRLASIGVESYASFDPQALRDHYAEIDLLVTMRLHAGIFALSVGTPVIGIYRPEWGPKMEGTFETLDIENYALTWEEATEEKLTAVTETALTDSEALAERIASNVRMRNEQLVSDFRSALRAADGFGDD
jgi:polysaccharide pyruvyl transferase WcaK-like protein